MAGSDPPLPPGTASGPGVPYAEWPSTLGEPRWHRDDQDRVAVATKSRREIVAQYRRRRPESHTPVRAKVLLARAREAERVVIPTRLCSFQVQCQRGRAVKKCHQCIQFDPHKLGYYCDACFEARHPSYRIPHAWSSIEDEVIPEQSWMTHLAYHNLEQDARELQLLLAQTQSFLQTHGSPPSKPTAPTSRPTTHTEPIRLVPRDPLATLRTPTGGLDFERVRESVTGIAATLKKLVEQIHTELAKNPMTREDALVKIQTMWRIRKARKQMRELLQSVYQSFTDPTSGAIYYYNTRTKETTWRKPKALGRDALGPSPNQEKTKNPSSTPRTSRLLRLADADKRREVAAQCIQGMARTHAARRHLRRLISSVYEKIWDATSGRFYYHNTKTDEVKWARPKWVNDDELLTPRTRDARDARFTREHQQKKLVERRDHMTVEIAASMVQRAFRRRRGFRMLLEMCRDVYERIYDADAGMYYYHNTRTHDVTWDKPLLLRHARVDVYSPRSRETHLRRERAPRHEWTQETAAARLQGLYRARVARRELAARLVDAYKKVWDPTRERFYYANLTTGTVSWDAPALLQRRAAAVALEEFR